MIKEYNQTGHVPYKEKDRLYAQFKEISDQLKKELNISVNRKRLDDFKNNLKNVVSNGENDSFITNAINCLELTNA